jgi:hypothetical protein
MSGSEVVTALIPRAASSGREAARLSFVTDSHSLLFGIQREREREIVQTSLCNSLLILYEVFLFLSFIYPLVFTNDIS